MVDEKITIAELGGYTNNSPNMEGIKKVVKAINDGLNPDLSDYYTKEETQELISAIPQLEAGVGIAISDGKINIKDFTKITENFSNLITDGYTNTDIIIDTSAVYNYTPSKYFIPKGSDVTKSLVFIEFNITSSSYGYLNQFSVPIGYLIKSTGTSFENRYVRSVRLSDPIGSGVSQYIELTLTWNSTKTISTNNIDVYGRV